MVSLVSIGDFVYHRDSGPGFDSAVKQVRGRRSKRRTHA
jgi:hypothetical protein